AVGLRSAGRPSRWGSRGRSGLPPAPPCSAAGGVRSRRNRRRAGRRRAAPTRTPREGATSANTCERFSSTLIIGYRGPARATLLPIDWRVEVTEQPRDWVLRADSRGSWGPVPVAHRAPAASQYWRQCRLTPSASARRPWRAFAALRSVVGS